MNNIIFLLKNSLTIWIFPAFLIAVILKKYNINLENFVSFTNGLIYFYIVLFIITKTKFLTEYKKILLNLKYYLLTIISISVFYSAAQIRKEYVLIILFLCVLLFILYSIFAIKKSKKYFFNFNIFKNIIEIILCVSVIVYGTQASLTKYITITGMFEIIYIIFCLTIYIHLKKSIGKYK